MIGYTCKYMPVEIFTSMGVKTERIEPNVTSYTEADAEMHSTLCSYVKGVFQEVLKNDYEGVVLTSCCDSTRRLYDTLKSHFPDKFIYMLDLPRKINDDAINIYENSIMEMIKSYENFSGKKFNLDRLKKVLDKVKPIKEPELKKTNVGLIGARCNEGLVNMVKDLGVNIAFNISCTGDERKYKISEDNIMNDYAKCLFDKIPCLRMEDITRRKEFLQSYKGKIQGIIYHTVKFCDIYSYEYADLKDVLETPVLKVETDYTKQCEGQIKTRVEAFVEAISPEIKKAREEEEERIRKMKNIPDSELKYVLGIDSGSTSTNAVIMNSREEIVAFDVVRTGAKSGESANRALNNVLEKAKLTKDQLSLIVSTGYGRVSIPFADKEVTEISCHGKGTHYLNPKIRTIVDIGGQDSKAIKLNNKGEVIDFVMNDKCAAGTGRFMEMMARTLEIDIKDMGPESLKWKEDIKISSMCSVFAESEVISLIAQNKEKCDIIHALNEAIASKTNSLLGRVGKESAFMMTGGVAQNIGVVKAIEDRIGEKLFISDQPEIVGAIGASLFGLEDIR